MMTRKRTNGVKRSNGDINSRLVALRHDLDALQSDMRGLVEDAAGAATGQARQAMSGAMESAHGMVERAGEWSHDNLGGMREVVRSQPFAACVLSMSAGAIIGALLLR